MKKQLWQIIVLLSLVVPLSACGGGNKAKINVVIKDEGYQPNQFTVPAGAEVTLTAINDGTTEHEFAIMKKDYKVVPPFGDKDEAHIYWELDEIESGTTKKGTFTAPTEPGDYEVVCGLPTHIEKGMVATLTVK